METTLRVGRDVDRRVTKLKSRHITSARTTNASWRVEPRKSISSSSIVSDGHMFSGASK